MDIAFQIKEISQIQSALTALIKQYQNELARIRTLRGLLNICCHCKRVHDEEDRWSPIEDYISLHTHFEFSHGICPECTRKHYPGYNHEEG